MSANIKAIIKSNLTCGSCAGFVRENLFPDSRKNGCCKNEGKTEDNSYCPRFKTDVLSLSEKARVSGTLNTIFETSMSLDQQDLRLLGAAFFQEYKTRESGFMGGQKLYVRIRNASNRNFLSNFVAARVLSADAKTVLLVSDDGTTRLTYPNSGVNGPSLYSEEAFEPLKQAMLKAGNFKDPMDTEAKVKPTNGATFKKAPRKVEGIDGVEKHVKSRGKKSKTYTLTDIVAAINSGYDLGSEIDEDTGYTQLSENKFTKPVSNKDEMPRKRRLKLKTKKVETKKPSSGKVGRVVSTDSYI